jgi:hypothetical protein
LATLPFRVIALAAVRTAREVEVVRAAVHVALHVDEGRAGIERHVSGQRDRTVVALVAARRDVAAERAGAVHA